MVGHRLIDLDKFEFDSLRDDLRVAVYRDVIEKIATRRPISREPSGILNGSRTTILFRVKFELTDLKMTDCLSRSIGNGNFPFSHESRTKKAQYERAFEDTIVQYSMLQRDRCLFDRVTGLFAHGQKPPQKLA